MTLVKIIRTIGSAPPGFTKAWASETVQNIIGDRLERPVKGIPFVEHRSKQFTHLVNSLLKWDPNDRLTAKQSLEHEFFNKEK